MFLHKNQRPNIRPLRSVLEAGEPMVVLVAHAKGGCGKTTLATNTASILSQHQHSVSLLDLDPLESSLYWLKQREKQNAPHIHGQQWPREMPISYGRVRQRILQQYSHIIMDAPAGTTGPALDHLVRASQAILIPVLPSPIDIHATTRFIKELLLTPSYRQRPRRIGIVANRANQNTLLFDDLKKFLLRLKIPYLTHLRDTQMYPQASGMGLGIHELNNNRNKEDSAHWQRIYQWLEVQRQLALLMPSQL